MSSGGRRRRRGTRSERPSHDRPGDGVPTFRHNQWTFEGSLERFAAFSRGRSSIRRRGGRRAISNADLVVPVLVTAVALAVVVAAVGVLLMALL